MMCRYCGDESFIGNAHPCCERWMGHQGQPTCIACQTSKALKRREVPAVILVDDSPEVERIEWRTMTIRQQFPWTRTLGEHHERTL